MSLRRGPVVKHFTPMSMLNHNIVTLLVLGIIMSLTTPCPFQQISRNNVFQSEYIQSFEYLGQSIYTFPDTKITLIDH